LTKILKIAFIGGGNMGEAMLSALLNRNLTTPESVSVSDISMSRRQYLKQEYAVSVTGDNRQATFSCDVIILAIKPQNLDEVLTELSGHLKASQLVLSIVAGARISTISHQLNHRYVVRAMPNTPAQIGEGVTVWTATDEVTGEQKKWAGSILGAMGKEIFVDNEQLIDMATAVSGSGPAYLFLFVELLIDAAVNIGLPRNIAEELVLETVLGSGHLIQKSGKQPTELRRMVTSPGGTTAEALLQLEKGGFAELLTKAVSAAYDRAKKLGKG